jgi:sugar phosphate isomerase/epimerase
LLGSEERTTVDRRGPVWPSREDLVLSAQTVSARSLDERLEAAAVAGFTRIGLRPADYEEAGRDDASLLRRIEELGLRVVELSAFGGWGEGGEAGRRAAVGLERFLRMSAALGGEYLVAFTDLEGGTERAAEAYGALCDRFAPYGVTVALEFAPFTDIADAGQAGEIARCAARPNAGVLVDTWHHFRGAADDELIQALPAAEIVAVHIDDGPAEPVGAMREETTKARLLPGEGQFGVASTVAMMGAHGVRAPVAVEVLSDELRALDAATASELAFTSSARVVEAARDILIDSGRPRGGETEESKEPER